MKGTAMKMQISWIVVISTVTMSMAAAQQYVFPAKGQSPEQQKADESYCYNWAVQQTGVDPAKPPTQQAAPKPPTTATGTAPGAGARGAARGAVVGELVADDPRAGATAGAVAARGQSRRQNAAASQQQQAGQQQQAAGQQDAFARARGACLEGKGYTIK
jgi:hypothetical protein